MNYKNHSIIFEPIPLESVKTHGETRYNSNNHWVDNIKPPDYFTEIDKFHTSQWVNKINRPHYTIEINEESDLKFLSKVSFLGKISGKLSSLYYDDITTFVKKYEDKYDELFKNGKKYFVKCENVSLKYGHDGLIAYTNFRTIIESLITCPSGHTAIYSDTKKITIYLFDWTEMKQCDEYRVFVKDSQITCISQQFLYEKFDLDENVIKHNITQILDSFVTLIDVTGYTTFSYDIVLIENIPYFIEPNCFGKEYAAGSALFHWIIDSDKLYGVTKNIYVRYII